MVLLAGLKPVFVDVDFKTASICPAEIEKKITDKTKAIFLTHLNGISVEMDSIKSMAAQHGLRIIEDCARACGLQYKGQKLGSFDIGAYSFSYGKNFFLFGGGMVTSNDDVFIERLRKFKTEFHSKSKKQTLLETIKACVLKIVNTPLVFSVSLFPLVYQNKARPKQRFKKLFPRKMPIYEKVPASFSLNMNNVQAKQGLRFLKRINSHNSRRGENALIFRKEMENLKEVHLFQPSPFQNEDMLYFAVQSKNKVELQRFLVRKKIDAEHESARNLPLLAPFKQFEDGEYPHAAALENTVILLPSHPHLTKKDVKYISDKIKEFS
jgi:perosamine synthetase